jgi:hypothetical protein
MANIGGAKLPVMISPAPPLALASNHAIVSSGHVEQRRQSNPVLQLHALDLERLEKHTRLGHLALLPVLFGG